jgi:hypothetical protein
LKALKPISDVQSEECWKETSDWIFRLEHHRDHAQCVFGCYRSHFASTTFIGIFANKVMTIDYIQWLSIHLYVVGRSMVGWINFGLMQSILGHIG